MDIRFSQIATTVIPATDTEEAKVVFVGIKDDGSVGYYKIGIDGEWVLLTLPTE